MSDQTYESLNQERPPRVNRRLVFFVVAALALAITSGLYFRLRNQDAKPEEKTASAEHTDEHGGGNEVELSAEALEAAKIEYATTTERPAVALLRVTGTVEANQQHVQQVTPLVGGRVERVLVALGDRVRAGAPLAVVSSPQIAEMHGKLHESETRLQNAERNLARVQKAENRAAALSAKARLVEAEAALKRTRRLIELGAGAGIEAGKPLFTVADISTLWVIANVPEAQVGSLRVGTPAEVRASALGDEARTARVRVEVTNQRERLKVGMFVEVGFQTEATRQGKAMENELVIPEEAVQRINERTVVFLPKEGEPGHFESRDVGLGGVTGGYQRVISGLKSGERVVSKGSFTLKTQLLKGEMGEHEH